MKLSELIAVIGDDNVMFQNLDNDIIRLSTKQNGSSEITFGTKAATTFNGTAKLGLVIWLEREAVEKASVASGTSRGDV
jgi:hypothetical protein